MGWLILVFFLLTVPVGCDAMEVAGQNEDWCGTVILISLLLGLAAMPRAAGWRQTDGASRWKDRGYWKLESEPGASVWDDGGPGAPALLALVNVAALVAAAIALARFGWPEATTWGSIWGSLSEWVSGWLPGSP